MTAAPQRTATARQEEIVDRTLELVRAGGLARLTIRGIAERVGFTEAALYRHFASKQTLLLALMERLEQLLLEPIRRIAGDETQSVPERLERIVRHHARLVLDQNSLPIVLLAEASASGDEALIERMREILGEYLAVLTRLAQAGQACDEIVARPPAEVLSLLLLGAPAALAIRHRLLPDRRFESRFEKTLIPFLIGCVLNSQRERTR